MKYQIKKLKAKVWFEDLEERDKFIKIMDGINILSKKYKIVIISPKINKKEGLD